MKRLAMFETLDSRYFLSGNIVLLNELHIGSGKGDGETDALVIKDHDDIPFIPGSSLRGALRSTIERMVSSLGFNPCLLINDNPCVTTSDKLQDEFSKIKEKKDPTKIRSFISDDSKVCPVCQLFGSTIAASKIRITDLPIDGKFLRHIRDGVAIDRDTETAKEGAKFDFEAISKGTEFKFELIGENLNERDLGLLGIGLQELVDGNFWVGGNTSRGLGKCKLKDLKINYFQGADGLKEYLVTKKLMPMVNSVFFDKIRGLMNNQETAGNA